MIRLYRPSFRWQSTCDVIAEGVETSEQRCVLQKKECTHVQGYLYSPPIAPENFLQQWDQLHQKAKAFGNASNV
jgi:EAL domain-containing protein (putative c-di-GMP-specific phosphodiesterase class I)